MGVDSRNHPFAPGLPPGRPQLDHPSVASTQRFHDFRDVPTLDSCLGEQRSSVVSSKKILNGSPEAKGTALKTNDEGRSYVFLEYSRNVIQHQLLALNYFESGQIFMKLQRFSYKIVLRPIYVETLRVLSFGEAKRNAI